MMSSGKTERGERAAESEVRIVWDVTTGDEKIFEDRMGLIQQTADIIHRRGLKTKFRIIIHGPATAFITKTVAGTKFAAREYGNIPDVQNVLAEMDRKGIGFTLCQVPMTRNNVSESNILPFIEVSENVFVDLALLQREGYSYIPIP